MQTLTLFVSSPGDVRDERQAVGRIVERLQARYWNFVRLEPVLWEKEPLRATAHFNEELIRPSDCDLFVCVLWSRLGSPLPSQFNRADGTRYDSGTEWELVEATEAYEARSRAATPAAPKSSGKKSVKPAETPSTAHPDILVYRRMSEPPAATNPEDEPARAAQRQALERFCKSFFFNDDGTIRRAFSPYETVDEFSMLLEQHLEKLILRHIRLQRGLAEESVRPLPLEGSPFKGLGAFAFEDAALFFGRNRAIAEALEQLKKNRQAGHAFLLIYGGSGYGKSSLMRAGLAPRLTAEGYLPEAGAWRRAELLPGHGGSPAVESLARALVAALPELAKMKDPWDSARLTRMLAQPQSLALALAAVTAALDRVSAAKPAQLLVTLDQLEEIFTSAAVREEDRDAFFNILAAMAMSRQIWVVATMRSEFFPRVPEHRDLYQLVRHGGGYILAPPELPELHQIIRYPALAAGLQFERHPETGRDLSEQIYQDASDAADALPLLEFTLEELYQKRRDNLLTWAAYEELGGLSGAIAQRAQETFEALPLETRREAARHLFGELVTLDTLQNGPATRRRVRRDLLVKAHPGAPGFLEAFIAAKLLVTGSEDQQATVTLAHEALITHWPVLHDWIAEHRELLLARRRLEDATRLWSEGRRSPKFHLSEGRLAEAWRVQESGIFQLGVDEQELIRISRQRARRKLRLFQGATVVFAGLAAAAGGLGWVARQRGTIAEQRQIQATTAEAATRRTLAATDYDSGALRLADGSPDEALPYLLSALDGDPQNLEAQSLLLGVLRQTSWQIPVATLKHPLPVRMLAFSPDGGALFSGTDSSSSQEGFNSTLRWDLKNLSIQAMLRPEWGERTQTLSISPDGRRVVIRRGYKAPDSTLLCRADTLEIVTRLADSAVQRIPSTCFAWSPDGLLLGYLTVNEKGQKVWRICDAATGATVRDSGPLEGDSEWLAAHLSRTALRAVAEDGTVLEMPLNAAQALRTGKQETALEFAVFSPDGTKILAALPGQAEDAHHTVIELADFATEPGTLDLTFGNLEKETAWTRGSALLERFPWSAEDAPFWERLMPRARAGELLDPLRVDGTRADVTSGFYPMTQVRAPLREDSRILSMASSGPLTAVGTAGGMLTLHEWLPSFTPLSETLPTIESQDPAPPAAGTVTDDGWTRVNDTAAGQLQRQGNDWRLQRPGDGPGKTVPLPLHHGWDMISAVAVNRAGDRLVLAGFSSGTGGYSSSGMVLVSPQTGQELSDIEPVTEIRSIDFLGASNRIAATGSTEVIVAEAQADGFRRVGAIPMVDALSLKYLEGRGLLAIAGVGEIGLYDPERFAKVATLPIHGGYDSYNWEAENAAWAEDREHGWLAYAHDRALHVWSIATGRAVLPDLPLDQQPQHLRFDKTPQGWLALAADGGLSVPLARVNGLQADEVAQLHFLAEALAGVRFGSGGTRALEYLAPEQRKEQALAAQEDRLAALMLPQPGLGQALARLQTLSLRQPAAATWTPVWERIAFSTGPQNSPLARWASGLGAGDPWYHAYLCGQEGAAEENFYRWLRGQIPPAEPPALPEDESQPNLLRLLGQDAERRELWQAAWLRLRTEPQYLGPALAQHREDEPELPDAAAILKLDPEALGRLRQTLQADPSGIDPWKLKRLSELDQRPAALERLKAYATRMEQEYQASPDAAKALRYAEALAWQGDLKGAADFLTGKIEGPLELPLEQAHFLIASGLAPCVPAEALAMNVERLASPWLWNAWLDDLAARDPENLAPALKRATELTGGKGPVAVHALALAFAQMNSTDIAAVLQVAQEVPNPLREYAAGRALWGDGKKAEVFGLWPKAYPDLAEQIATREWHGWDLAIDADQAKVFFEELDAELATLKAAPDAPVEQQRALAKKLLDPQTVATFGGRRVRDALVELSLNLAYDKGSHDLVLRMIEQARLAGADPGLTLRAEARALGANGEPTAAYARWIQLLDQPELGMIWNDYIEAGQCLLLDGQDEAMVQLMLRGKNAFPEDATYAYQAAWVLLTANHPEESGILLEHGFTLPFDEEQTPTATAMLVCAAELTQRKDRATQAFKDLVALDPAWGDAAKIKALPWPPDLKKTLQQVAARKK